MKDNLKEFIQTHREEFDEQLAPELWASISAGIKPPSHLFINLKKLANMFKYAFGASALVIGSFFIFQSLNNPQLSVQTNTAKLPNTNTKTNESSAFQASETKVKELLTFEKTKWTQSKVTHEVIAMSMNSKVEKGIPLASPEQTFNSNRPPLSGSMISHPAQMIEDTVKSAGKFEIDTLFKSIKELVVTGIFCEVTIVGKNREDLSFKANVNDNAGSVMVFGKTVIKKEVAKIRYSVKDSTLTVWIEMHKLEHKERSKKSENEKSELAFEVPTHTRIRVTNQSGDIEVNTISSSNMHLESSFGEIEAENIQADLFVKATSGNIELKNIQGMVQSNSSFGKQKISEIKGNIKLNSSSGDITIKDLQGNANVTSSFGFQKFENVTGNIHSVASSGNIEVEKLTGNLITKSSFGNQDLDVIDGNITASASSGDITLEGAKGIFLLNTTFGNIRGTNIQLLNNCSFTTSSGNISMQILNDISELSFDLTSSSGDLHIKKGSVEFNSDKKLSFDRGPIKIKGLSSFGNQSYK